MKGTMVTGDREKGRTKEGVNSEVERGNKPETKKPVVERREEWLLPPRRRRRPKERDGRKVGRIES